MADLDIRLRCTECRSYRAFERERGSNSVRCRACGKRHSTDSLRAVEPGETPDFED